jgi:tetratricopeptide (TPR) repeat protein
VVKTNKFLEPTQSSQQRQMPQIQFVKPIPKPVKKFVHEREHTLLVQPVRISKLPAQMINTSNTDQINQSSSTDSNFKSPSLNGFSARSAASFSHQKSASQLSLNTQNTHKANADTKSTRKLSVGTQEELIKSKSTLSDQKLKRSPTEILNGTLQKYMNEADNFIKKSHYKKALECYDKVILAKPDFSEAFLKKARCLRNLNKHEESLNYFDTAIKLDPNNLAAMNYKGFSLKTLGKLEEAKSMFEKANIINDDPSDVDSLFNKV